MNDTQILEVLRSASHLMKTNGPSRWTQGVGARDSSGNAVPIYSKKAQQWSVLAWVTQAADMRHASPDVTKGALCALTRAARGFGYQWMDDIRGYNVASTVLDEAASVRSILHLAA